VSKGACGPKIVSTCSRRDGVRFASKLDKVRLQQHVHVEQWLELARLRRHELRLSAFYGISFPVPENGIVAVT
jgi:hypothetical protein